MNPSFTSHKALPLAGRMLVALLFIPAGLSKLAGFAAVVGYIASKGVPLPALCAVIAIAIELGLGLLLLTGFKARWAALGLAIFVVVVTPIFHNFWALPPEQVLQQQQAFFKNLAIMGGLLALASFGPGAWSLDGRRGEG